LAARFFDIRALPRLTIHLEDAAAFLKCCTAQYGIVIVDTYIGGQMPDQCTARDFLKNAKRSLLDDGVLAVNWLNEDSQKRKNLQENLQSVFGQVWQLPCLKSRNLLYFAPARKTTRQAVLSTAAAVQAQIPFENSLKRLAQGLRNPR
jgi:spermidine synthase